MVHSFGRKEGGRLLDDFTKTRGKKHPLSPKMTRRKRKLGLKASIGAGRKPSQRRSQPHKRGDTRT